MPKCHRCGRAVPEHGGTAYLFDQLCDREECKRVKLALSNRWTWFWFKRSLPAPPEDPGRVAAFTPDGEYLTPRGMCESSLNTLVEANRMRDETQEVTADA